jgi:NAD+ diphosphatase
VFTPGVATDATSGLHFVVSSNASLCVIRRDETIVLPSGPAADAIYLGDLDGTPCFARWLGEDPVPAGAELAPLRQLFGSLTEQEFGIAGRALGLTSWDRDHRFCGRCGAATERSTKERVRTCTRCGHGAYPRLSPAVIVLVERDGKCLLARNARTRMPLFSTLAGFVEVGETLEQCVAREIREEAGIELAEVRYFGSQPWPFTGSLMVGFTARWASGELAPDPDELLEASWFAPDALPAIPPKLSIARELIDDFVRRAS